MTDQNTSKVVRLSDVRGAGAVMAKIREIAKDTAKVFLTDHAVKRMFERGISDGDVFKALRVGEIRDGVWEEEDGKGCKVVLVQRGDRTIGVISILIDQEDEIVVKTVEWED